MWQIDLLQIDMYSKHNNNYKFLLIVIDCFSKFVWCKPLKTKSAQEVTDAFESVLKENNGKRKPNNLQTDQGREFFNIKFQHLMKKYEINHYHTYSKKKASIVERAIRTIKEKLFKFFSLNGSYRWRNIINDLITNYNNTVHHTIRMRPIDVNKKNKTKIFNDIYKRMKILTAARKFAIGDFVRISKEKHIFEKGYTPNWTTELFKISKINNTNPPTYLLEDLHGAPIKWSFYEAELQKTQQPDIYLVEKILRRRGNKVYVKWLGFDSTHNSWIDKNNA